jgi:hypothetical protein
MILSSIIEAPIIDRFCIETDRRSKGSGLGAPSNLPRIAWEEGSGTSRNRVTRERTTATDSELYPLWPTSQPRYTASVLNLYNHHYITS